MSKKTQTFEYQWLEEESELLPQDRNLLVAARQALKTAYAPYSHFRVAAAIRLKDGRIIVGSNQENAAYPMCLCAERVALAAVESQAPNATIEAMAITVHNDQKPVTQPAAPCGACRQVISEREQRQKKTIKLILQGQNGPLIVLQSGSDLLPFPFGPKFLDQ